MRLITYRDRQRGERIGTWIDQDRNIVDLALAYRLSEGSESPWFGSMLALIDGGEEALRTARALTSAAKTRHLQDAIVATADIKLLSPLPEPRQMRDCLAFEKHYRQARERRMKILAASAPDPVAKEAELLASGQYTIPKAWYETPFYYKCNRFSVIGSDADIEWPPYAELLDYELEFGIVIGQRGKNLKRTEALGHVFGYTIFNDVSARDTQNYEMPSGFGPAKSKDFDTGNVLGPCLVTTDEIPDPYSLTMVARVNGEEQGRGNSSEMHHKFEDMLVRMSASETIHPGEFIGSGTVGDGCGLEKGKFLSSGDVIELSVERIGTLRNRIVRN
jgi:2-keto-4-pentenoate hydratase/2-oxohepta-3-ene-1,7-dioic acid hydratase in catechol pathway